MTESSRSHAHVESSRKLAALAEEAVRRFREEHPEPYRELVGAFAGQSADLALLGQGGFHVAVTKGELKIDPEAFLGGATARGAATPETLLAILEGRLTPLNAFFKGDLMVRAKSPDLHLAYDYFVKFADAALRSARLRELVTTFRETFAPHGVEGGGGGQAPWNERPDGYR